MRLALLLAYDGTELGGWQRHPRLRTVQGLLEQAFQALGLPVQVQGASRTDAGVHARGQVAHVDLPAPPDPAVLRAGLNRHLPDDVRVLEVRVAPPKFNARWASRGKVYGYLLAAPDDLAAGQTDPFLAQWAWVLPDPRAFPDRLAPAPLDEAAMAKALRALLGTRDFRGLATLRGSRRTGREMRRLGAGRLTAAPWPGAGGGRLIRIEVAGDAFLRHQVRNLVGLLAQVGYGELGPDEVASLVEARRGHQGPRAPGRGLSLLRVRYPRRVDPFV